MTHPISPPTVRSVGWPHRVSLFGIELDAINMSEAVALLVKWTREPEFQCRYVVTPNVDHVVMLQKHEKMRQAYADASLVVADGWPIVAASRWLGRPVPERVAGSDLVPQLFEAAAGRVIGRPPRCRVERPIGRESNSASRYEAPILELHEEDNPALRVFLLGAAPGVGLRAARNICTRWPGVEVVGVESPALGFERRPAESAAIAANIAEAKPDLLVVGLGAPKQELWVHAHRAELQTKIAICAGATIDFLAGVKHRAPRWMRRTGLEWFHRMITEPRRLGRRYARGAIVFPRLVWRERARSRKGPLAHQV